MLEKSNEEGHSKLLSLLRMGTAFLALNVCVPVKDTAAQHRGKVLEVVALQVNSPQVDDNNGKHGCRMKEHVYCEVDNYDEFVDRLYLEISVLHNMNCTKRDINTLVALKKINIVHITRSLSGGAQYLFNEIRCKVQPQKRYLNDMSDPYEDKKAEKERREYLRRTSDWSA